MGVEGRTCSKGPRAGIKPGSLRSGLGLMVHTLRRVNLLTASLQSLPIDGQPCAFCCGPAGHNLSIPDPILQILGPGNTKGLKQEAKEKETHTSESAIRP